MVNWNLSPIEYIDKDRLIISSFVVFMVINAKWRRCQDYETFKAASATFFRNKLNTAKSQNLI